MKAILIDVFSNKSYESCSNGGITERTDELMLICDEGYIKVDETNPPANLVKVVTRTIAGREYKHIEPYETATGVGYMHGGSYASSSDSRFSKISQYPLAIHDRQESQELYNSLSR